jgi:uncharacterized protein
MMNTMKLSTYHLAVPVDGGTQVLLHSFVSGEDFIVNSELYTAITEGNWKIPSEMLEELLNSRIVVKGDEEFVLVTDTPNNTLYVSLLINSRCQLACRYCGQDKTGHVMTEATQKMTLEFIQQSLQAHAYSCLKIVWFGAEPALNVNLIQKMSSCLISMAKKQGCRYISGIVTNGIALEKEVCDLLVNDCQISRFEITLDGFQDNERRVNVAGKGFYDEIVANLLYLTTLPCQVTVRCNVDRYNAERIWPMLEHFKQIGLHNKVEFYIAMIHSWGSETGSAALDPKSFAKLQISIFRYMLANGFLLGPLLPHREQPRQCIMQLGENGFLVDAYGLIYTCSELPYTHAPETIAGHVSVGRKQSTPLFQLSTEQLKRCRACRIYPVCGGGCAKRYCEHGQTECLALLYNMEDRARLMYEFMKTY